MRHRSRPTRVDRRARLLLTAAAPLLGLSAPAFAQFAEFDIEPATPESMIEISPTKLYLQAGVIDASAPRVVGMQATLQAAAADDRFIVQLDGPMTPARRAALADAGLQMHDYIPSNAWIVSVPNGAAVDVGDLGFIRWHALFDSSWKIAPGIGQRDYATPERQAMAARGEVGLIVSLFEGMDTQSAVETVARIPGAQVHYTDVIGANPVLSVTMPQQDVGRLANVNSVQFIEEAFEITFRNSTNRWIVQTGQLNNTPLYDNGIHGEGQVVGILDGQLDHDHCSFNDSNPIGSTHRKIQAYNSSFGSDDHGTHVGGTVVGDAGSNNDTRGVAYMGRLVFDTIPTFSETGVVNALSLHEVQGATIHTNSWGNDGTTSYDSLARGFDVFQRVNETNLCLLAVTNTSTLRNPENAKNLLAVGASQDTPNFNSHCSGGVGPTSDGRRKPEIYAPGCGTVSSDGNTSCGTRSLTGTSMATPAVAGAAMLVRQYYNDGFYPSGVETFSDAINPTGALIKATLLNSAVDMTGISGYPSNLEGWGRVRASDALYFAGDARKLIMHDQINRQGLTTGEAMSFPVTVATSGEPLKVTVVWTDVAATAGASFAPVNNLDLEVVSPTGTTYRGNVFSGGFSTTGGTADIRNNVEQVHINAPDPGQWTVNVIGTAVNSAEQGFAMVATGDVTPQPAGLTLSLDSAAPTLLTPGDATSFDVTIAPGADTLLAGSPTLHYSYDGGAFQTTSLTPLGGDTYRADLPAAACADTPAFYVSAESVESGVVRLPVNGASAPFTADVGEIATAFSDDFESDQGWSVGDVDDDASTGVWTRVNPVGTAAQPEDDNTAAGTLCFVTGQGSVGGGVGDNDVDGGKTTLFSPSIDLSGAASATISYARWYSNTEGASPNADVFVVDVSNNGGASWTNVETVGPSGAGTSGGWVAHSFAVENFVPLTDQVVVRFIASDEGSGSIVEAGVDDFLVETFECVDVTPPACPGDATGDGLVNFDDLNAVLGVWGTSDPSGDVAPAPDGDGMVNFDDLNAVLGAWLNDCTP